MINYTLREAFKSDDTIESSHLVLAEWNMNNYQEIEHYGIYGVSTPLEIFSINDVSASIRTGNNYLLYNDEPLDSTESKTNKYFSKLASVFEPNRPDPGIVLLQQYNRALITTDARKMRVGRLSGLVEDGLTRRVGGNPRYYPFSETRKYDYFNSAKQLTPNKDDNRVSGVSDALTNIKGVNPYVTYKEEFPINKIVIKVQNHASWPDRFSVDILDSSSSVDRWIPVYQSTSSADFSTGQLELYYTGDRYNITFSKTVKYVDDLINVASVSNIDTVIVKGIRFNVDSMFKLSKRKFSMDDRTSIPRTSLELIEISPRLEINMTNITETFSINSDIAQTNFGLPVGGLVTSNGNIQISNSDSIFMFNGKLNQLKLLSPDVLFKFYQRVTYSSIEYVVPIKEMYAVAWNIQNDFSVSIDLEDKFKIFKKIKVPDLVFWTERGIPLSVIILVLLDNCGVTGLEFKKRSNNERSDNEDTKILNFYCKKEETLLEVLEKLAISTQSAMYIDAVGKLNVLTKERLTAQVRRAESTSSSGGTDFWLVGSPTTSSDPEHAYISDYIANISSIQETKVNPITDGTITYHNFDIAKSPGGKLLQQTDIELKSVPPAILAVSDYVYKNTLLWQPKDNDAVLSAASLTRDTTASGPSSYMSSYNINAIDSDAALRKLYFNMASGTAKQSMVIVGQSAELQLFTEHQGYVYLDNECIKYRGILYKTFDSASPIAIFFSREEYDSYVSNIQKGKSIIRIGLMVDIDFKVVSKDSNGNYNFKIMKDGRGSEGTEDFIKTHYAYTKDDPMLNKENRYKIILGGTKKASKKNDSILEISNQFDYLKNSQSLSQFFEGKKRAYATIFPGHIKVNGPKALANESSFIGQDLDADTITKLSKLNEQVDLTVAGGSANFDLYLQFYSDKNIHAQRIDLSKDGFLGTKGFTGDVNYVSTTMRLVSPQKLTKDSFKQDTLSSIGGIGININPDNGTGYYLEVQAISDRLYTDAALASNLRFYKITYDSEGGGYKPKVLLTGDVAAVGQVYEGELQVIDTAADTNPVDPVFTLSITIKKSNKDVEFGIYYGTELVGKYSEKIENGFNDSNFNKMCLFVRSDSQAIYEDFIAAQIPKSETPDKYFAFSPKDVRSEVRINSVSQDFIFNNKEGLKVYYNDFASTIKEAKLYEPRFENAISLLSRIIDVSRVNPQFHIVEDKTRFTPFGAKLFIKNTIGQTIRFSSETLTPLFITGIALQELNTGTIKISDTFKDNEMKNTRSDILSKNAARYGINEFSIDSLFIQRRDQAKSLSDWILKNCCYERKVLQCEIFANPILELGDRVRVFDRARGYYINNESYEDTVYVISTITYEGTPNGVSMSVRAVEVGQK